MEQCTTSTNLAHEYSLQDENLSHQRDCYYLYLIKLDRPLGGRKHQARYYLGVTHDLEQRLMEHRAGCGAKMLGYASRKGIGFEICAVWSFDSPHAAYQAEQYAKRSVKNHQLLMNASFGFPVFE